MDRHEHEERHVRRHRARAAARRLQHAHSSARRSRVQPGRSARRQRVACDVHRLGRRRLRRVAPRHAEEPAAARHARRQDSPDASRSSRADGTVVPTYPVVQYGHVKTGGDAIGDGFLYRGTLVPALQGKYVFTDIAAGRLWYADYLEMLAADDGNPKTMATMHEVKILWNGG